MLNIAKQVIRALKIKKVYHQPKKSRILVFDAEGVENLKPLFADFAYEILDLRYEKINLHYKLCIKGFINLVKSKNLLFSYAKAYIEIVNPSVVITFIDNHSTFWRLDQEMNSNKIKFIAIQNGRRNIKRDDLIGQNLFHSNFFCYGRFDMDQYNSYGAKVVNYYPLGSLKDSLYRLQVNKWKVFGKVDIALISDSWFSIPYDSECGQIRRAFDVLCTYLSLFIEENKCNVVVVCRHEAGTDEYTKEVTDFKIYLGDKVKYAPNNRQTFNSYIMTDSAEVVLGVASSLLVESFGRNKKVLSCNYSGDKEYDFPAFGICSLTDSGYEKFSERLLCVMEIKLYDYLMECSFTPSYYIGYDAKNPVNIVLSDFIREQINNAQF